MSLQPSFLYFHTTKAETVNVLNEYKILIGFSLIQRRSYHISFTQIIRTQDPFHSMYVTISVHVAVGS